MLDWWVEKLGLKVVAREDDHKFALVIGEDGAMIGLFGGSNPTQQKFIPYFKSGNLEETVARLRSKSVNVAMLRYAIGVNKPE